MAADIRNRRLMMILSVCGVLVLSGFLAACMTSMKGIDSIGHSQFGAVAIPLGSGKVIYARREGRGLNYDVLSLSPDPNPCAPANAQTDYVFRYDGTPLYLTRTQAGLTVYRYGSVEAPRSESVPRHVEMKHLTFEEFQLLQKSYQEEHIQKLEVPFKSDSHECQ